MGADASIFQLLNQQKPQPGPLDNYAQMMSVKQLMGGNELQDLQRTNLTRDLQEEDATKQLFTNAGDMSAADMYKKLLGISPTRAMAFQKSDLETQGARAKLEQTQTETVGARAKQGRDLIASMTPENYSQIVAQGAALKQQWAATAPPQFDPKWQSQHVMDADKFITQNTPKFEKVDIGGKIEMVDVNPVTNPKIKDFNYTKTMTPGEVATDKRAGATLAETRRHHGVTESYMATPDLADPEVNKQIDYWAGVVKNGGSLPPGLARSGSGFVKEVTKRAAMGDVSPTEMLSNQAQFAGEKAGQRTLGNRTANIEMAVTEAQNVIPIALAASEKVDRTKYPTLNSLLIAAEKGTGDENVAKFAASTNALINIYSRAIAPSGVPTVSDKDHAREIISTAYSKGQFKAVTDVMQQELSAARQSPGQVKKSMRDQFTGKEEAGGAGTQTVTVTPSQSDINAELRRRGVIK